MKKTLIGIVFLCLFCLSNCDKVTVTENNKHSVQITGFIADKCVCCWGWVIKLEDRVIKADSIPGLDPGMNLTFPAKAVIEVGNRTRSCEGYGYGDSVLPDYYEIKSCTLLK
jgi:hypothetical protein